jgi:hypothetical protein
MKHATKKPLFLLALLALFAACGAPSDDLFPEEPGDSGEELGSLGQPVLAFDTPSFRFGAQTSNTAQRCSKTSTSQVCTVPSSKVVNYFIPTSGGGSFTFSERDQITGAIGQIDGLINWSFTQVTDIQDADYVFSAIAVPGNLSSNIEGYVRANRTFAENLSDNGLPGSFQRHEGCVIAIDKTDIYNKGANATQDGALFYHAALNGPLKCMGIGSRTDTGASNKGSQRQVQFFSGLRGALTSGEVCALNAFVPAGQGSNPGQYAVSNSVCPSN